MSQMTTFPPQSITFDYFVEKSQNQVQNDRETSHLSLKKKRNIFPQTKKKSSGLRHFWTQFIWDFPLSTN